MAKSTKIKKDKNRSLSNKQIENMTPEDLLVALFHCQFIEDPTWVHILTQQMTRVLATYSDLFEKELRDIQIDEDISNARISILMRNVIGIKDSVK